MDISISQVYKTTEYSKFKFLDENRQVNQSHVKKLMESFERKYIPNPIIVNEYGHVIDGQNRLTAAMNLKFPVYYIVIDGLTAADIAPLNYNAKNWNKNDYLSFYSTQGLNPVYKIISQYRDRHPLIHFSHLLILMIGARAGGEESTIIKKFYEGDLSTLLTTRDIAINAYERFLEKKTFMAGNLCSLINVFSMISVFDWDRFFNRLEVYGTFERQGTTERYVQQFDDVYNYYLKKDVVDLLFEYKQFKKKTSVIGFNEFREYITIKF